MEADNGGWFNNDATQAPNLGSFGSGTNQWANVSRGEKEGKGRKARKHNARKHEGGEEKEERAYS
jgi:hypothetical protein